MTKVKLGYGVWPTVGSTLILVYLAIKP